MAAKEFESPFPVDGVGTVEEFDFCPIGHFHIMEKLGAKDRTEAVAIAVRRGMIQL